jgi:hypothetical protein
MNDFPVLHPEAEPDATDRAQKEAARISEQNLRRDERIRNHIHLAGLIVFWVFVFVVVLICLSLILAWHIGAPESWRFLNVEQRDDLKMVLLSAVGSSFVTVLSKRWLNPRQQASFYFTSVQFRHHPCLHTPPRRA